MSRQREALLRILEDGRAIRPRDLEQVEGGPIPRMVLARLVAEGFVVKEEGIGYRLASCDPAISEELTVAEIAQKHPTGVLCFYTALRVNQMVYGEFDGTDEYSNTNSVALPYSRALNQRSSTGALVVSWPKRIQFELGVEETFIAGARIRYTGPERTVADMFRVPPKGDFLGKGDAMRALGGLARARGVEGILMAADYAKQLGWGDRIEPAVQAMKELMPSCAPRTP